MKTINTPINVRATILKGHYFKKDLFTGNFIAPHGNSYSLDYINGLNDEQFEEILRKETI